MCSNKSFYFLYLGLWQWDDSQELKSKQLKSKPKLTACAVSLQLCLILSSLIWPSLFCSAFLKCPLTHIQQVFHTMPLHSSKNAFAQMSADCCWLIKLIHHWSQQIRSLRTISEQVCRSYGALAASLPGQNKSFLVSPYSSLFQDLSCIVCTAYLFPKISFQMQECRTTRTVLLEEPWRSCNC